jgi:cell cycle protein kinase DBF2
MEVFALKKLRKNYLYKQSEINHIQMERDILARCSKSEWLTHLYYAFHDSEFVYLALEYLPGGDFRSLLNASGVLRESHARFYVAQMMIATNELHKLGYIHRYTFSKSLMSLC